MGKQTLIEEAWQAFKLDRDNPDRQRDLQELAEIALQQNDFQTAVEFAAIGLRVPKPIPSLPKIYAIASQFHKAEVSLAQGDYNTCLTAIKKITTISIDDGLNNQAISYLLHQAYNQLTNSNPDMIALQANTWRQFAELAQEYAPTLGHRINTDIKINKTKYITATQELVDKLFNHIHALMSLDILDNRSQTAEKIATWPLDQYLNHLTNSVGEWEKIGHLVEQLLDLSRAIDNYRLDAAKELQERVKTQHQFLKETADSLEKNLEQKLDEIEQQEAKLEQMQMSEQDTGSVLRDLIILYSQYLRVIQASNEQFNEIEIKRMKAIQQLSLLRGRESWQQISNIASEQLREMEDRFVEAKEHFTNGEPEQAKDILQALLTDYALDPEWQELQDQVDVAIEWRNWQQTTLQHKNSYKAAPLSDIRQRVYRSNLPAKYWQEPLLTGYLDGIEKTVENETESQFPNYRYPIFAEQLRKWVDIEMTRRIIQLPTETNSATTEEAPNWPVEDFMRHVSLAAAARDINRIQQIIKKMPVPSDLDIALTQIDDELWQRIAHATTRTETPRRQRQSRFLSTIPFPLIVGSVVVIFVVVIILGILLVNRNGSFATIFGSGTTPTAMSPTEIVVVAPIETLSPPTATPTFVPTPTPAFIPTPTSTPTPTDTPTPTPLPPDVPPQDSRYFQPDPLIINPSPHITAEAVWLINPQDASINPEPGDGSIWTTESLSETEGNFYHTNVFTNPITVSWTLDIPLNAGLYQLYVMDTVRNSAGPQSYQVQVNGQSVVAYRGQNQIIFDDETLGQNSRAWLPIGFYEVLQGQMLTVTATITEPRESSFAITPLLITKLPPDQQAFIDMLPTDRQLVALLDDSRALFLARVAQEERYVSVQPTNIFSYDDFPAWNGTYQAYGFDPVRDIEIHIEWPGVGRLPAGEYELRILIPPEHATVMTNYKLLVDGAELEPTTPRQINQQERENLEQLDGSRWITAGIWTLDTEANAGVQLSVSSAIQTEPGEIGVDAVALLYVDRQ